MRTAVKVMQCSAAVNEFAQGYRCAACRHALSWVQRALRLGEGCCLPMSCLGLGRTPVTRSLQICPAARSCALRRSVAGCCSTPLQTPPPRMPAALQVRHYQRAVPGDQPATCILVPTAEATFCAPRPGGCSGRSPTPVEKAGRRAGRLCAAGYAAGRRWLASARYTAPNSRLSGGGQTPSSHCEATHDQHNFLFDLMSTSNYCVKSTSHSVPTEALRNTERKAAAKRQSLKVTLSKTATAKACQAALRAILSSPDCD